MRIARHCIGPALCAVLMFMPARSYGQVLGVFADPEGTNCSIAAPVYRMTNCYLVLRDPAIEGAVGIELGIRGLPAGWLGWIETCELCSIVLPSAFGDGAILALQHCATGDPLVLAPVVLIPTTDATDVVLEVGPKIPPSDPAFDCPVVYQCDSPNFTGVCVQGMRSRVNSSEPCTISVAGLSWTALKSLYE
jgi:hypothetical protein